MSISTAIQTALDKREAKGWDKTYIAVDLHDTVVKSTYTTDGKFEIIQEAIRPLKYLTSRDDIVLILWTASSKEQLTQILADLNELGIIFDYFNENPEVTNTSYADFSGKLFFDILIDDKAGFEISDWRALHNSLKENAYVIYGGSFNPPTVAHRAIYRQLRDIYTCVRSKITIEHAFDYKNNNWADYYTRRDFVESYDRYADFMGKYMIDEVKHLDDSWRKNYIVIGSDNLKDLTKWKDYDILIEKCEFIIIPRGENNEWKKHLTNVKKYVILDVLNETEKNISSTMVRERIKNGQSIKGLVPEEIEEKVIELYK